MDTGVLPLKLANYYYQYPLYPVPEKGANFDFSPLFKGNRRERVGIM